MSEIRPFQPDDVPQVAALRRRVFARSRRDGAEELEGYLRRVFFESPWHDPGLPSWVGCVDGRVGGFLGVVPRPFVADGRTVRCAVATQFMVAPEYRGMLAIRLVRQVFAGAQDLLYTDVANPVARAVWHRMGGSHVPLLSLFWSRPLRRARHAALSLGNTAVARGVRLAARPLLAVADRLASPPPRRPAPGALEPLDDPATVADALPLLLPPRTLAPRHDGASLAWLLRQARERWPEHHLHALVVRGTDGAVAGWFVALDGGGSRLVLQMVAAPGWHADLLRHLFRDAWAAGNLAVRGRAEPAFLDALDETGCRFHREGHGMLVHARDPALLHAVLRGDALLSGLDGEWWLDF